MLGCWRWSVCGMSGKNGRVGEKSNASNEQGNCAASRCSARRQGDVRSRLGGPTNTVRYALVTCEAIRLCKEKTQDAGTTHC